MNELILNPEKQIFDSTDSKNVQRADQMNLESESIRFTIYNSGCPASMKTSNLP